MAGKRPERSDRSRRVGSTVGLASSMKLFVCHYGISLKELNLERLALAGWGRSGVNMCHSRRHR